MIYVLNSQIHSTQKKFVAHISLLRKLYNIFEPILGVLLNVLKIIILAYNFIINNKTRSLKIFTRC